MAPLPEKVDDMGYKCPSKFIVPCDNNGTPSFKCDFAMGYSKCDVAKKHAMPYCNSLGSGQYDWDDNERDDDDFPFPPPDNCVNLPSCNFSTNYRDGGPTYDNCVDPSDEDPDYFTYSSGDNKIPGVKCKNDEFTKTMLIAILVILIILMLMVLCCSIKLYKR
jgi:hypothetical protein